MKKYRLEIAVFVCGAIGMILELVAARVLSPYVGNSNLIWTTIIGVILTSMSLGYWIGGKIADKNPNTDTLSKLITLGGIFTCLIPILEIIIVQNLAELAYQHLTLVAFISTIVLFGVPSFILATISPYTVKLKDEMKEEKIGKLSGKISSLSTIGSIIGTFLGGFVLIQMLGIRTINLVATLLLLGIALLVKDKVTLKDVLKMIIIAIIAIGVAVFGHQLFGIANPDVLADVESEYSRIWVKQVETNAGTYKTLQVGQGLESYINQETGEMGAEYLKYYDLAEYFNKENKGTLLIGGAAYTYPMHYLKKYQDKTIDVVEIDEKMTEIAKNEFGLNVEDNRLKIHHQDGRSFLNYADQKYDSILIDAFKGIDAPFELTTYEALQSAKNRLKENGVVITNIISSIEGEESDFLHYEYKTYEAVFDDVRLFQVINQGEEERQNLILVGIKGNPSVDENKYEEYKDLLEKEIKGFKSDAKVVTDNYTPIGN